MAVGYRLPGAAAARAQRAVSLAHLDPTICNGATPLDGAPFVGPALALAKIRSVGWRSEIVAVTGACRSAGVASWRVVIDHKVDGRVSVERDVAIAGGLIDAQDALALLQRPNQDPFATTLGYYRGAKIESTGEPLVMP